ncbi:Protein lin-54-like protein [Larimichthys crocea]|uniref:Uncharacterized protein n=1 Tax=Larimichthys crocea TaxID=215358 RepID=A0ACD3QNS6_LARCR|nr:Protein lin-54-like protein [Larimichthys crocea]
MDVVSPELNSLLPDEIMDTEAIEDIPHSQPDGTAVQSEPGDDTSVPMETDTPAASENVNLCPDVAPTEHTQTLTTSAPADSTFSISTGSPASHLHLQRVLTPPHPQTIHGYVHRHHQNDRQRDRDYRHYERAAEAHGSVHHLRRQPPDHPQQGGLVSSHRRRPSPPRPSRRSSSRTDRNFWSRR